MRTPSASATSAASGRVATRAGSSTSTFASTSLRAGSPLITVACRRGAGSPVRGSIRWCAATPSAFVQCRRLQPDVQTASPSASRTYAAAGCSGPRGSSIATT